MSMRLRQRAHPRAGGPRAPALALVILVPLAVAILVRAASAADAPEAAIPLDAAESRRAGVALTLVPHPDLPGRPLEVLAPDGAAPGVLLGAAPAGTAAVIVPSIGPGTTLLTLARADGSQLQVPMDGALAATFAPDGAWLAVVDASGRLWRLDADDGDLHPLADGPFIDAPLVEPDGSVLALAVSSIEAPFSSHLVRVDLANGGQQLLSAEELVYGAVRLGDGSLAVVAHRPGGTFILRVADGRTTQLADLGPGAVNVALSADGNVIAWEAAGAAHVRVGAAPARSLGEGERPAVAADGSAILLERGTGTVLVDLEGHDLAALGRATALLACADGCAP